MFASTLKAREILRKACDTAGTEIPDHTYTEKTTDNDRNRRSVVFPLRSESKARLVVQEANRQFEALGLKSRAVVTNFKYRDWVWYVRVIAYKQ